MLKNKFLFGRMPYFNKGSEALGGGGGNSNNSGGGENQYPSSFGTIEDTSVVSAIAANKWQSPSDAVKSFVDLQTKYAGLEKTQGVLLPDEKADKKVWDAFYNKLGRPETVDKYDLNKLVPEKQDQTFAKEAANWFHEAGITQKQAEVLSSKWNEFNKATLEAQELEFGKKSSAEFGELQVEYGKEFDNNMEIARRGLKFVGEKASIKPEMTETIERAIGTKAMLKMFNAIGKLSMDAKAPDGSPLGQLDANQAKVKIDALRADKDFQARYHSSNSKIREAAIEEMNELSKIAYGDGPNATQ